MRELTIEEMEQVDGGIGPGGAVLGAVVGAATGYQTGGIAGAATGAAFGAVGGFFGGITLAATGISRLMFGAYTVETYLVGNAAVNQIGVSNS